MPSPGKPSSPRKHFNEGFSLLEVIVALAIMAVGFVTVLQLFSGSIRSVGLSEQYLKAVTLGNSKLNQLELTGFNPDDTSGTFEGDETYRWELNLRPYDSPLNNPDKKIELLEVILKVLWNDSGAERDIELATIQLKGQTFPAPDSVLTNMFRSGNVNVPDDSPTDTPSEDTPAASPQISGSSSSRISGSGSSANISGN